MSPLTYLFVPGNRPERFDKALNSGADRVVVDLEDAVALADKVAARRETTGWLSVLPDNQRERVLVRIHDAHSTEHEADLDWLSGQALVEVMLAKAESAAQVDRVRKHMRPDAQVMPLVETVRGVMGLPSLASARGVSRLAFGSIDYQVDLGVPGAGLALDAAALAIAMASRAAELPPPVAGVTTAIEAEEVRADVLHARALGFGAKLCIHPRQIEYVREALRPDAQAIAWATRVDSAWRDAPNAGVIQLDGRMVDKPVVLRAQQILELAAATSAT